MSWYLLRYCVRSFSLITSEWDERIISIKITRGRICLFKIQTWNTFWDVLELVLIIMNFPELLLNSSDPRGFELFAFMPCLGNVTYSIGSIMTHLLEIPRLLFSSDLFPNSQCLQKLPIIFPWIWLNSNTKVPLYYGTFILWGRSSTLFLFQQSGVFPHPSSHPCYSSTSKQL